MKSLRHYRRNTSQHNLDPILAKMKAYKNTIRNCQIQQQRSIINALAATKNNIKFRATIIKLNRKQKQTITYFNFIFSEATRICKTISLVDCLETYLDILISHQELLGRIKGLKNNKSHGGADLIYEFYKFLPSNWRHYLLNLFNNIRVI